MPAEFHDIGAVVLFLLVTPWQIPNFTVDRYREQLRRLHDQISAGRPRAVTDHRFLLVAQARPPR